MFRMIAVGLVFGAGFRSLGTQATPGAVAGAKTPLCSTKTICLSGELSKGNEFHQAIDDKLELVLEPERDTETGWNIRVVPRRKEPDCDEFAVVVTPPYRFHSLLDIDTSYGISAEDEVTSSPRDFNFVTNCKDSKTEFDRLQIVLWPYSFSKQEVREALAKLGSSPLGRADSGSPIRRSVMHLTRRIAGWARLNGCGSRLKSGCQD